VRSTDLNAKIGLSQLRRADEVVGRRVEIHQRYQEHFLAAGWHCQTNARAVISSISFAALAHSSGHRDRVAAALRVNQIETRPRSNCPTIPDLACQTLTSLVTRPSPSSHDGKLSNVVIHLEMRR
jgi:dTDP-4-amino-4,6-dideoxygalactose transaminase